MIEYIKKFLSFLIDKIINLPTNILNGNKNVENNIDNSNIRGQVNQAKNISIINNYEVKKSTPSEETKNNSKMTEEEEKEWEARIKQNREDFKKDHDFSGLF